MRRTNGVYGPVIRLPVRDKGSNTDDQVVDVLRKFVADRLPHLYVGLADEIVGGREPGEVGHGLQVPDDDGRFHILSSLNCHLGRKASVYEVAPSRSLQAG